MEVLVCNLRKVPKFETGISLSGELVPDFKYFKKFQDFKFSIQLVPLVTIFISGRLSKPYPTRDGLSHLNEACWGRWGVLNKSLTLSPPDAANILIIFIRVRQIRGCSLMVVGASLARETASPNIFHDGWVYTYKLCIIRCTVPMIII